VSKTGGKKEEIGIKTMSYYQQTISELSLVFQRSKFMFRVPRNGELSRWSPFKTCKIMTKDKKGGRPKLSPAEKLKYRIAVNLCTKDFYALKAKAAQAGMTCTEIARQAIIGCQIRQRLTQEQMDCIRKLSGMGNNLNQITRKANVEGYTNARSEYLYLADEIDKTLTLLEYGCKDS
jgi:hypothetical protein